jgi:hypothetical protein
MFMHSALKNKNCVNVSAKRSGISLIDFAALENSLNDCRVNASSTQGLSYSKAIHDVGIKNAYQQQLSFSENSSKFIDAVALRELP